MIKPQTQVRSTQGDAVLFRIPEDKLRPEGLKRKKRLERYNNYKRDLFDVAQDNDFLIPDGFFKLTFFVPIPKSYKKHQRIDLHLRPHQVMPDVDNFLKAFLDALKRRDQSVHHLELQKVWIDHPTGFIQIEH